VTHARSTRWLQAGYGAAWVFALWTFPCAEAHSPAAEPIPATPAPKQKPSLSLLPARASATQSLRARLSEDRVSIHVGGQLFTEYLFLSEAKYPYFYPVNGPRSGASVTARNIEPYPHHSSIFFGCDRVNDGNYWQEGLDRGRIVSLAARVVQAAGNEVVIEQDCRWERPGAEAPFDDHRRIVISAPSPDQRCIDFTVTLRARLGVRIQKTNHSLFAARMAPDLSVQGGGALVNALGGQGEAGTFGRPAPWADYRGQWRGVTEGVAIFSHPSNRWSPPPWFTRDYGFFSPTPMFWLQGDRLDLAKGQSIHLRYRVLVHADTPSPAQLQALYEAWSRSRED
jgi:hypothetical protein